jgi:hypothetical protein
MRVCLDESPLHHIYIYMCVCVCVCVCVRVCVYTTISLRHSLVTLHVQNIYLIPFIRKIEHGLCQHIFFMNVDWFLDFIQISYLLECWERLAKTALWRKYSSHLWPYINQSSFMKMSFMILPLDIYIQISKKVLKSWLRHNIKDSKRYQFKKRKAFFSLLLTVAKIS